MRRKPREQLEYEHLRRQIARRRAALDRVPEAEPTPPPFSDVREALRERRRKKMVSSLYSKPVTAEEAEE